MFVLRTTEKKSVTQVDTFVNENGETATHRLGWRWGSASYEENPDLTNYNPDADEINIYSVGDPIDIELDDGCWGEWEFSEGITEQEQDRIIEIYDEDGESGLDDEGWTCDDSDIMFAGPLEVTEED